MVLNKKKLNVFELYAISCLFILSACSSDGGTTKGTEPVDDSVSSATMADIMAETSSSSVKDETISFDSAGVLTDSRDGQTYKIVKIGDQVWMAENLNYDPGQGGSEDAKYDWSWCYDNNPENCAMTGRLYSWAAAIDSVKLYKDKSIDCGFKKTCSLPDTVYGICPPGWHLPTIIEWKTLFAEVGEISTAGKILKSQTGWYDYKGSSGNGTDAYGFSALPAGRYGEGGMRYFCREGGFTYFWSATDNNPSFATRVELSVGVSASLYGEDKPNGFSVRCLQN